ncbi:MAG: hypothetical protein DMF84_09130 [Acidobacteria bacterium]|nr:MAG: hypothetical protein DMF84_09130 [Acidobacteriota bacterium]
MAWTLLAYPASGFSKRAGRRESQAFGSFAICSCQSAGSTKSQTFMCHVRFAEARLHQSGTQQDCRVTPRSGVENDVLMTYPD